MHTTHGTCRPIEVGDPYLQGAAFVRDKRETFSVGSPSRPISILIGNQYTFRRSTVQRHNPDVRRLLVRRKVYIDNAEYDPFAVGRRHGLGDTLELHHVFEGERAFGLREACKRATQQERENKETAHSFLRETNALV